MFHCKSCKHNNEKDYEEYCIECQQFDYAEDEWILNNFEEKNNNTIIEHK